MPKCHGRLYRVGLKLCRRRTLGRPEQTKQNGCFGRIRRPIWQEFREHRQQTQTQNKTQMTNTITSHTVPLKATQIKQRNLNKMKTYDSCPTTRWHQLRFSHTLPNKIVCHKGGHAAYGIPPNSLIITDSTVVFWFATISLSGRCDFRFVLLFCFVLFVVRRRFPDSQRTAYFSVLRRGGLLDNRHQNPTVSTKYSNYSIPIVLHAKLFKFLFFFQIQFFNFSKL